LADEFPSAKLNISIGDPQRDTYLRATQKDKQLQAMQEESWRRIFRLNWQICEQCK
jgi:hypothetical protein